MKNLLFALWATLAASSAASDIEEVFVPIYEVFDQGQTNWCWAYSGFHTLRTYYFTSGAQTPEAAQWREALSRIDSAASFKEHMEQYFLPSKTGDPQDFVKHFRGVHQLPDPRWTAFYPKERTSSRAKRGEGQRLNAKEIMQKVKDGILRGVPSVYCNRPHCMMIFGAAHANGVPAGFLIADSHEAKTYWMPAEIAESQLDLVLTLPDRPARTPR